MNKWLDLAVKAAIGAGNTIMEIYGQPVENWEVACKDDQSPLTLADRRAHEQIVEILQATPFPILSEEGVHETYAIRRQWTTCWVVDPLDGTKEFIKRNGEFTVNIALVEHGTPILGVVYVPVTRVLYYGSLDDGAMKALVREGATDWTFQETLPLVRKEKRPFTIVASRTHLTPETENLIECLREQYGEVQLVCSGSSLKICQVAEGTADIYPRLGPTMEWDTAAGHALVLASGAEMVDARTQQPLVYNKENLHNPWFIVRRRSS